MDKMIGQFLWDGKRKVHLVNWEMLTHLKEDGGLGIKKVHEMNLAFMAKVGWRKDDCGKRKALD